MDLLTALRGEARHSAARLSWARYKGKTYIRELHVLANAGAGPRMAGLVRQVGAVLLTMGLRWVNRKV